MENKFKKMCGVIISTIAYQKAKNNVNSTCMYALYQPMVPKEVEKLKKNKYGKCINNNY